MTGVPKSERSRDQKLANAQNKTAYWKKKAQGKEMTESVKEVLMADPEMKWYILWLGAGAIEFLTDAITNELQAPTKKSSIDQAKDIWAKYGFLTLPGLFTEGVPSDLTGAGLIGKIMDWGVAGGVSATALAVIIIGRMSQGEGGGLVGKMIAAGV